MQMWPDETFIRNSHSELHVYKTTGCFQSTRKLGGRFSTSTATQFWTENTGSKDSDDLKYCSMATSNSQK